MKMQSDYFLKERKYERRTTAESSEMTFCTNQQGAGQLALKKKMFDQCMEHKIFSCLGGWMYHE